MDGKRMTMRQWEERSADPGAYRGVKAVYFEEPVDHYACIERARRLQVEDDSAGAIFLRGRAGRWQGRGHAWSIRYVLSGSCSFEVSGRECEVFEGFAFVIPAHVEYRAGLHRARVLCVLGEAIAETGGADGGAAQAYGVFPMTGPERGALARRMDALRLGDGPGPGDPVPDRGRPVRVARPFPVPNAYRSLSRRIEQWAGDSEERLRAAGRLLMARHYINCHFRDPDACQRAADAASMTRSHFSRRFSDLFEQSPRQYLVDYRKQVAAGLLASGQYGVGEVARMVGYGHSSSLAHLFKRENLARPRNLLRGASNRGG